jgi:hypothetical protein
MTARGRRGCKRRPGIARRRSRKLAQPRVRVTRSSGKGSLRAVKRPSWKLVGLAGVAGVAATGVIVARRRRAHGDLPPDELRERLHSRLAAVGADSGSQSPVPPA